MKGKLDIAGIALGCLGLFCAAVVTGLPMWKVSAFIGANLIVMENLWEGLWMNCFMQDNIRMQCKVYDSLLILPPELQAARGLMIASVLLAIAALVLAFCGTRRTSCFGEDPRGKRVTLMLGGILFLLSGFATLIAVSWTAHSIIRNFYNPAVIDARKHELGLALYMGWATAGLLLAAGIILIYRACAHRHRNPHTYDLQHVPKGVEEEEYLGLERQHSHSYSKSQYV